MTRQRILRGGGVFVLAAATWHGVKAALGIGFN
jgi:hypothetical protein